jgi:hypothetical protein
MFANSAPPPGKHDLYARISRAQLSHDYSKLLKRLCLWIASNEPGRSPWYHAFL